jgi:hypothetical protein
MIQYGRAKKLRFVYFLFSIFSLAAGFLLYYFYRKNNILIYTYFPFLPRNNHIITFSKGPLWLDFFRYNLPGGLLLLSGLCFLRALWYEQYRVFILYRLFLLVITFLLEIAQLCNKIFGTFDFYDLATMGSIALLEGVIHKILMKRRRSCVRR